MGSLNMLPCTFVLNGSQVTVNVSALRSTIWNVQLVLAILYTLYINLTLVFNVSGGLDTVDKSNLGTHLARAMCSANFSYWAYQIFFANFPDYVMMFKFTQSNQGKRFPCNWA